MGADTLGGGDAPDLLMGDDGDDSLWGDGGADVLHGGLASDQLRGGDGSDALHGEQGADLLLGEGGIDELNGGEGNDTLVGGADYDVLNGGAGADLFVFNDVSDSAPGASDSINDFNAAEGDFIDLRNIDANTGVAGDQGFNFVGAFSGQAGQAVLSYDPSNNVSTLHLDVNGDGVADFTMYIAGQHSTSQGWLL